MLNLSSVDNFIGAKVSHLVCVRSAGRRNRTQRGTKLHQDQSGQVMVIGAFIILGLAMISITVANVGLMVAEKIHLQDTVDAAAYSGAVVEARYMNLVSYLNRAMVANYNSMAYNTALWTTVAAHDHGSALVTATLYQIAFVIPIITLGTGTSAALNIDSLGDTFRDSIHAPMHRFHRSLKNLFSQESGNRDLNQYVEIYNTDILSMYQGLLYAAAQSARHDIQKQVALRMDSEITTTTVLGLAAETVSYDELARAADYVIARPSDRSGAFRTLSERFNSMAGTDSSRDDHPYLLGAVAEASLDKFSVGRDRTGSPDRLRTFDVGDLVDNLFRPAEIIIELACEAATFGFGDCDADLSLTLGAVVRDGQEDRADQDHVPFISRRRMREVNAWQISLQARGLPGAQALSNLFFGQNGYTSGDRRNDVANSANVMISAEYGIPAVDRALQSLLAGSLPGNPIPSRGLNRFNMFQASLMGVRAPLFVDDHWDGTFDVEPVSQFKINPPGSGLPETVQYLPAVIANGGTEPGVPNYDWQVELDDVGFFHYHYPTTGATSRASGNSRGSSANLFSGPSIAVVGVKRAEDVNGLRGLGIGNDYSMSAVSRAQVYYLRNPNRPSERPSLFNPHWVARLAPLDSADTPSLLRLGIPYVAGMGIPILPTR